MAREISTRVINRDIERLTSNARRNVSDRLNTFDELYTTALAFIYITLTNNKNTFSYINTYPDEGFFEIYLKDDSSMFPQWDMKFPIRYLDEISKFTP